MNGTPSFLLLAVATASLTRVIEHLLRDVPGIVIEARSSLADAIAHVGHLRPDVIVASARLLARGDAAPLAALQERAPDARLVLITCGEEGDARQAMRYGAAASIDEEDLVRGLAPIIHILSGERAIAAPQLR